MSQLFKMFFISIVFCTKVGCNQRNFEKHQIGELITKFPQLQGSSKNSLGNFYLVRKVSFGNPSICLELFSQPDSTDDKQELILQVAVDSI